MATQIFFTYLEFLRREDKNMNGVSPAFAERHADYEAQNETNRGCYDCSGCSRCSRCSGCYGCSDEKREDADAGFVVPMIPNIHQAVLAATSHPGALNMSDWHTCETTHCRAGWVEHLAGEAGKKLADQTSTLFAAMQIYHKSSPTIPVPPTRFFVDNIRAMEDMQRCAELEAEAQSPA
ncbi:MAG: hypothetical protein ACRYFX_18535 [Janthinobacterium lividum]